MEHELLLLKNRKLQLEDTEEALCKTIAESLDTINSLFKIRPTPDSDYQFPDYQLKDPFETSDQSPIPSSEVWAKIKCKLKESYNSIKDLQTDNRKLIELNLKANQQLERETEHAAMLDKEIEVISKEKVLYDKMYQDTLSSLNSAKENHAKEVKDLKEYYEAKLKDRESQETYAKSIVDNRPEQDKSSPLKQFHGTLVSSSQISTNLSSPSNQNNHLAKLRSALGRAIEENKRLTAKITTLEDYLLAKQKPVYDLSQHVSIIQISKNPLVESEIQTIDSLATDVEQSAQNTEYVNELNNKIEKLIFREIELQTIIDDLEFKLRCHKKFISSKLY